MTSVHTFVSGLDLRKIRHLVALAEHQSFGRAAEAVFISQSALSRSIQSLEDSLGVQLFDRSGRTVRLTPVGQICIEAAQQILRSAAEFHRLVDSAAGVETGDLKIGLGSVASTLIGPPLLRRYAEHHPQLLLTRKVDAPETLYRMLLDEELDVVVGNADALPRAIDFEFDAVANFARGFFARAGHPLAERKALTTDILATFPVGTTYPLPDVISQAIMATYGFTSLESYFRIRSNHYSALIDLMMSADAIVFGSNIAYLRNVWEGSVVRLDVKPEFLSDMTLIIARKAGMASRQVIALVGDVVREVMSTCHPVAPKFFEAPLLSSPPLRSVPSG